MNEDEDANETKRLVEEAGRKAFLICDIQSAAHCRGIIEKTISHLNGIDILVNNAAHQATFKSIEDISDEEWELTFKVNIHAMFYLVSGGSPYEAGSRRPPTMAPDQSTARIDVACGTATTSRSQNFTAGWCNRWLKKEFAPMPWRPVRSGTPLIPSTMSEDAVAKFGSQVPMKCPGQPAELIRVCNARRSPFQLRLRRNDRRYGRQADYLGTPTVSN